MDFTRATYKSFLQVLQLKHDNSLSFQDYRNSFSPSIIQSIVILRHDVDRSPKNALKIAQIENSLGISGTYYFRITPESYNLEIMNKILNMGHEIGYHYEDIDLINSKLRIENGELLKRNSEKYREILIDMAYESFCKNLVMLRRNFDIKTICMHGSPKSKYDNRIIWEKYNYKDLGIIGEPYYDIDWNEFAYFTDTGRRWNGNSVSIRDKVNSRYNFNFKTTQQIIDNIDKLPNKVMFTVHPERWNDSIIPWVRELVWQNVKNQVKKNVVMRNLK